MPFIAHFALLQEIVSIWFVTNAEKVHFLL